MLGTDPRTDYCPVERNKVAMRFGRLVLLLCALGLVIYSRANSIMAQEGRNVLVEARFAITDAPLQSELVQQVVDFAAGAWTSPHSHGGQAINLVLEGEITLRRGGVDKRYTVGQSWTDSTSQVHAAGNTGQGKARLLTNFLLPRGSVQTTVEGTSPLQPSVTYEARFPVPTLPADAEIRQQAADLDPGWRERKGHGGFVVNMVVEGEVAYGSVGDKRVYKAGEAWSEQAGVGVNEENLSGKKARIFTTYLLPAGVSLSVTPGPAGPSMIDSASRPGGQGTSWPWPALASALLAVAATVVGMTLLRRKRAR
ncbi:MAG TPA: cupin domain-containing protein [Chloroflexia bacterium]|nr:cupin domain-containing protein [Chloroflexia bacterium]